jgi:RNA polymerase sigma-70 factor (ECF subfamily)
MTYSWERGVCPAGSIRATALNHATIPLAQTVPDSEPPGTQGAQLLSGLAAGDRAALERWFHEHQAGLYAFAYYRVGQDADLAADATQATFAAALERLAEFDPQRGQMAMWLRTLARNVIRGLLIQHRRGVQMQMAWDEIDETLLRAWQQMDCRPLPEEVLQRQQTRSLVAATLANLPPQYQAVLQAKYLDGQPLEAIAQRRQTTLDGAKSMLRRARAAFRECFLALAGIDRAESEVGDV